VARAVLVAPDRSEDCNDHGRNDDREAALGAGDLFVRFVICGACARTGAAWAGARGRAVGIGDPGTRDAHGATHAAGAKGDACAAHAGRCGEAALAQVERDAGCNLDAAKESKCHARSLAQRDEFSSGVSGVALR
jgi:hypothetical protein